MIKPIINKLLTFMPDKLYIQLRWKMKMNYPLNLDNPRTFNEKLQWMKLYNRNPEYTTFVDKYAVKQYVADIIGEEHIIPTLGVWDKFADIDFGKLPNQFVLKCTHNSGGLVICKDKSHLNMKSAEQTISRSLASNYYYHSREWPYKNVPRRIIAEKYMEDTKTGELRDYKFYCFDGVCKAMLIAQDRSAGTTKMNYYDSDFNKLDMQWGYPNSDTHHSIPERFDEMKRFASALSKGIPHVRVDFYEVDGRVYFGDMTFFDGSGMTPFHPAEWDSTFGSWITLPEKRN